MGRGRRRRWRVARRARAPSGGDPQARSFRIVEVGRHHGRARTHGLPAQRLVQVERTAPLREPVLDEGESVLPAQRLAVPRRTDEAGDPVPVHDERPVPRAVSDVTIARGPRVAVRGVVDPQSDELQPLRLFLAVAQRHCPHLAGGRVPAVPEPAHADVDEGDALLGLRPDDHVSLLGPQAVLRFEPERADAVLRPGFPQEVPHVPGVARTDVQFIGQLAHEPEAQTPRRDPVSHLDLAAPEVRERLVRQIRVRDLA